MPTHWKIKKNEGKKLTFEQSDIIQNLEEIKNDSDILKFKTNGDFQTFEQQYSYTEILEFITF